MEKPYAYNSPPAFGQCYTYILFLTEIHIVKNVVSPTSVLTEGGSTSSELLIKKYYVQYIVYMR
jgi:hypothetical protein